MDEEAFVLRVRKNAIIVIVPRYGVEGPVYLCNSSHCKTGTSSRGVGGDKQAAKSAAPAVFFDAEAGSITVGTGSQVKEGRVFIWCVCGGGRRGGYGCLRNEYDTSCCFHLLILLFLFFYSISLTFISFFFFIALKI